MARLAGSGVDLVVAADCCYIDQDGASPSTPAFVRTCAGLCGPDTRCLVSFERRAPEVRRRTHLAHAAPSQPRRSMGRACARAAPSHCAPLPTRPQQVRACLLEEARKLFRGVKKVPLGALPKPLRLEYVDIWELSRPLLPLGDAATA